MKNKPIKNKDRIIQRLERCKQLLSEGKLTHEFLLQVVAECRNLIGK